MRETERERETESEREGEKERRRWGGGAQELWETLKVAKEFHLLMGLPWCWCATGPEL